MSVFNNQYSDHVIQSPSLTGENDIRVNSIDFDTSCECQVTACDGGTIKFCAPVTFDPPLPPQPHSDGTCEAPIPLAVFTKIKFSGESECQIENCTNRGTNPIVACSTFNFTQGLIGSYAGTCDSPLETVVTDVLKFGSGGDCQIVSCEEANPINICSPVILTEDLGTCDNPVPNIVTDVLKLKGGSGVVPNIVTCDPTDQIYAHAAGGIHLTTDDDVTINAAAGRITAAAGDRIVLWNNTFSVMGMLFYFGPSATEGFQMRHDPNSTITSLAPLSATAACDIGTCTLPIETVYSVNLGTSLCPIKNAYIDNLTLTDDICVNGEIGCDKLAIKTGLTEGISFSDDPCDPSLPQRKAIYEDVGGAVVVKGSTNLQMRGPEIFTVADNDYYMTATTGKVTMTATADNILIRAPGHSVVVTSDELTASGDITADGHVRGEKGVGMGNWASATGNVPPLHDYGKIGDKAGDMAYKPYSGPPYGLYVYICFQDHSGIFPDTTQIWFRSRDAIFDQTF